MPLFQRTNTNTEKTNTNTKKEFATAMVNQQRRASSGPFGFLQKILLAVLNCFRYLVSAFQSWISRNTGKQLVLDTGRRVRIGKQIAEGGFSYVFEAYDVADTTNNNTNKSPAYSNSNSNQPNYVLKRIRCPESELLDACRKEAGVHRSIRHPNLMPLLGMVVLEHDCYMLFPCMKHSLRQEVNHRTGIDSSVPIDLTSRPPWNEVTALQVFLAVARGVKALHDNQYSHRDVKLENVMFQDASRGSLKRPVLMDFGSCGPTHHEIRSRKQLMNVTEEAATHTTISYRPPELFEGSITISSHSISSGGNSDDNEQVTVLDYTKVDVWSLGCTLFGMLYGASPSECEFSRSDGRLKIVECSHLKVLGGIPKPLSHSVVNEWYSTEIIQLITDMLHQDYNQRISLDDVLNRTESLIVSKGGIVVPDVAKATGGYSSGDGSGEGDYEDDEDGIALISTNRLV